MPRNASYVLSPLFRVVIKAVTDFSGCPLLRLNHLLGGRYWLFSLATSQLSVLVSVHLYNAHAGGGGSKFDPGVLWTGAGALAAAWSVSFLYFAFRVAVPRHRKTLWSGRTGRLQIQEIFTNNESDETKFELFRMQRLLWEGDIGEDVKAWCGENWARWKEEREEWFKPELVPDEYIPARELALLGGARKRRGSASK
jgi:hypothetical protein